MQGTGRAHGLGVAGQVDGFVGGVGAQASNDRNAAGGMFDGNADQFRVFFHGDRGRLPGGAHHHQRIGTFLDVPVDQRPVGSVVQAAIGLHWGDQGHHAALEINACGGSRGCHR